MNSSMLVLSLVLLATVAYCQVPVPCITPPQWEARILSYDRDKQSLIRARFSYDSVYQRERSVEEYRLGTEDDFFDVIRLYRQGVEYRFNLKDKTCTKQPITRPWRDLGIPTNSTSLGESYVGSSAVPNANVLTTIWRDEVTDSQGNKIVYLGTWTYEACLPVSSFYFSVADKLNTHTQYFDITPGLADPNVFIPRRECL